MLPRPSPAPAPSAARRCACPIQDRIRGLEKDRRFLHDEAVKILDEAREDRARTNALEKQLRRLTDAVQFEWATPTGGEGVGRALHDVMAAMDAARALLEGPAPIDPWMDRWRKLRVELTARQELYSTDIFAEPPPGKHGATVDACSARAHRHLLRSILETMSRQLEPSPNEDDR
jgi:hypothetical protein